MHTSTTRPIIQTPTSTIPFDQGIDQILDLLHLLNALSGYGSVDNTDNYENILAKVPETFHFSLWLRNKLARILRPVGFDGNIHTIMMVRLVNYVGEVKFRIESGLIPQGIACEHSVDDFINFINELK